MFKSTVVKKLTPKNPIKNRAAYTAPNDDATNGTRMYIIEPISNEEIKDFLAIPYFSIKIPNVVVVVMRPINKAPSRRPCSYVLQSYRGPYCVSWKKKNDFCLFYSFKLTGIYIG